MTNRSAVLLVLALISMAAGAPARTGPALAAASAVGAADTSPGAAPDTVGARAAHSASPHGHAGMSPPPAGGSAGKPFKIVAVSGAPRVKSVTLGIRHRVFHEFAESDEVHMREGFAIGDTPYSATVTDFQPDFVIDVAARRITSRSSEPRNPAFRIVVRENGVPRDTTWAFLNMPPHFAARSLLAFKILRIDFADRPPLLPDTSTGKAKP